ncbi:MAG: alanine racemase [Quadrisphaera sp.]
MARALDRAGGGGPRRIAANTALLVERAAPAAVMAEVKADAYGHGLVPAARAALAGGATWLGVAQLGEALALRAAGVDARVLCWLWVPGEDVAAAVAAGVDLSASLAQAVRTLADAARTAGRPVRLHLEAETGMGRGGAAPEDWPEAVRAALAAREQGLAELVGAWSHLARADEPGHPEPPAPAGGLRAGAGGRCVSWVSAFALRHLANSAALLTDPGARYDLVRPASPSTASPRARASAAPSSWACAPRWRCGPGWRSSRTSTPARASLTGTPTPPSAPPGWAWCRWGTPTACPAPPAAPDRWPWPAG